VLKIEIAGYVQSYVILFKIHIEDNLQITLIGKKGDTGYFLSAPITI
jgi:hypothetical protein